MTGTRAYLPPVLETGRSWGFSVNLYALRSKRNWGMGDFTDLATIVRFAARLGAGLVGVNPLHALHYSNPESASPYSPTSRYFLNPMYVDIEAVPEMLGASERAAALRNRIATEPFASTLGMLRDEPHIAYSRVARAKYSALEELYGILREERGERGSAFATYVRESGTRLERFAVHEALVEHFERNGDPSPAAATGRGWTTWPPEFRDAGSEAVRVWAAANRRRVDYFKYLQWLARDQLAAVAAAADGLEVGLFLDVAVGVDLNSADVWTEPSAYVLDKWVGAPPDPFGPLGQNWGLAPPEPHGMLRDGGALFAELLAHNMAFAGALRLDHVMALRRLFQIPHGMTPADGAYVDYPMDELLAIAETESTRAECLIVGEDLGTVPDGFRDRMTDAAILSYRVFLFEREDDGSFKRPGRYPALGLATATTHDLPSIAAWALGRDLDTWDKLAVMPEAWAAAARTERRKDVTGMLTALRAAGELDDDSLEAAHQVIDRASDDPERYRPIVRAVYRFLASSPAKLVLVALDDALVEFDPVNLPGTGYEYPNWRRKNGVSIEDIQNDRGIVVLAGEVRTRVKGDISE